MRRTRELFEQDAGAYGFDLTRVECAAPEPWSDYADPATGHRWASWLARNDLQPLPPANKKRAVCGFLKLLLEWDTPKKTSMRATHTRNIFAATEINGDNSK